MGDSTSATQISKLDFSDPLYLLANDTSGTPITTVKLKGTEIYNIWSKSMLLALSTKNKIGFIKGTVIFSTNASDVWKELKETCDKIDTSIIYNLHHQINTLKQGDSTLPEYYHKLNTLWKQYDAMVSLPICTCNAAAYTCAAATSHKDHVKMMKLMQFLMGLNDEYTSVRSNILLRDTVIDVKEAYAIISREESHKGISTDKIVKTQANAFVSQSNNTFNKAGNNSGNFSSNNNNRNQNHTLKCKKMQQAWSYN
ncbi:uncharacterized protein [Rutidosis leptorrhynchoides]|uniref:uncharacterized protein n=1 Tax=Rutidosis leptorrhynchoides TaxID=125765 RepID=UPI003A9A3473